MPLHTTAARPSTAGPKVRVLHDLRPMTGTLTRPPWAKTGWAAQEIKVEQAVSRHIPAMPFLWLAVPTAPTAATSSATASP
jgi:hypothetical protein